MVRASCLGCGAKLRVLESGGEALAVRTCDCSWPPRRGSSPVHLPPQRPRETCELVMAWTE